METLLLFILLALTILAMLPLWLLFGHWVPVMALILFFGSILWHIFGKKHTG